MAALVLVFIPIDLWKDQMNWPRSLGVLASSLAIFVLGVASELMAIAVKRYRDKYEEEFARNPSYIRLMCRGR